MAQAAGSPGRKESELQPARSVLDAAQKREIAAQAAAAARPRRKPSAMPSGRSFWLCKPTWPSLKISSATADAAKLVCILACSRCCRALRGLASRGQPGVPALRGLTEPSPLRRTGGRLQAAHNACGKADAQFAGPHNGPLKTNRDPGKAAATKTDAVAVAACHAAVVDRGQIAQSARQRWEGRLQTAAQRPSTLARDFTH